VVHKLTTRLSNDINLIEASCKQFCVEHKKPAPTHYCVNYEFCNREGHNTTQHTNTTQHNTTQQQNNTQHNSTQQNTTQHTYD